MLINPRGLGRFVGSRGSQIVDTATDGGDPEAKAGWKIVLATIAAVIITGLLFNAGAGLLSPAVWIAWYQVYRYGKAVNRVARVEIFENKHTATKPSVLPGSTGPTKVLCSTCKGLKPALDTQRQSILFAAFQERHPYLGEAQNRERAESTCLQCYVTVASFLETSSRA